MNELYCVCKKDERLWSESTIQQKFISVRHEWKCPWTDGPNISFLHPHNNSCRRRGLLQLFYSPQSNIDFMSFSNNMQTSSTPHYLELACPKRGSKPPLLWVLKSLSNRCLFRNSRGIVVDTKFISNFLSWKSPLKPSLVGESNILKSVKSYSVLWRTAGKVQGTLSYIMSLFAKSFTISSELMILLIVDELWYSWAIISYSDLVSNHNKKPVIVLTDTLYTNFDASLLHSH